jgi:hypothetical protein
LYLKKLASAAAAGREKPFGCLKIVVKVPGLSALRSGAMISPCSGDGPSCTVTMPILSSASRMTIGTNPSRLDRLLHRRQHPAVDPSRPTP